MPESARAIIARRTRPLRRRLGLVPRQHNRYLLEEVIFTSLRELADADRILFVGVAEDTADYPRRFASRSFTTIDVDPAAARWGGDPHIVDDLANLGEHVGESALDVVICNGVIGWGLDTPEAIDRALEACAVALRPGGRLVLGWNDLPGRRLPVEVRQMAGLRHFEPAELGPFPQPIHPVLDEMRHVYEFLRRRAALSP